MLDIDDVNVTFAEAKRRDTSRAGFPATAARREIALQVGNRQVRPSPSLQMARPLCRAVSVLALPTIGLTRGPQGSPAASGGQGAPSHSSTSTKPERVSPACPAVQLVGMGGQTRRLQGFALLYSAAAGGRPVRRGR